jgi:UDP-GlcNAc:undecaprenyl-phosphate/decaprenyl-phosphate GlcNAc-1-phosphate transferase
VAVVFGTGLVDDLVGLRPIHKLLGQVLASVLVWNGGVEARLFQGFGAEPWISLPITVIWLVACTNAFNLIDGLDGLATGAGLFATMTMLAAAILNHNLALALVTVPLVGCLLGFLRYNFNPASIFLGDSGSLTIGFLLGCFGAMWSEKINTLLGLSAPIMAVSLPLIDTSLAIARRFLRRRPIFGADRGHIHHRLLDRGNSPKRTAMLLYGICTMAAIFSLSLQLIHRQYSGLIILAFIIVVVMGVNYLGYHEFGFAQRLLAQGALFHLVDDQIRLQTLETSLGSARSVDDALRMIQRTCHDLGFMDVFAVSGPEELRVSPFFDSSKCQICIPVGDERMIVLQGFAHNGRPLILSQLINVISNSLRNVTWQAEEVLDVEAAFSIAQPYPQMPEMQATQ